MFFDMFKSLCDQRKVSCKKAAEEMGLSNSITTKWKKTGATPSGDTLSKIAEYFGVTVDYLLGNDTKKEPTTNSGELTEKDKKDIAKDLENIMSDLENSGDLMFDGDPMSPEAMDSIKNAMAMALEYAKKINKEKYTPKKYRK